MPIAEDVEAARIAVNLARNCGYAVLPCRPDKRPACPHGFKQASSDHDAIAELWRHWPGPLVGVATGEASGIDVLDVDIKHNGARQWWQINYHRLPITSAYRTRGGGMHLYFNHAAGVRSSASKIADGIDTRGDGGYVISWFAAGLECLDHSLPAPWPAWLLTELLPKPAPQRSAAARTRPRSSNPDAAAEGVLRAVERAVEKTRNNVLHWAACRLGERIRDGQIGTREAETWLLAAARHAGLLEIEARATIKSGLQRAP
jgi:hypothetical protein